MRHRTSLPLMQSANGRSSHAPGLNHKVLAIQFAAALVSLGAAMALPPNSFAQSGKPSEAANPQVAAEPLSHDLSGVWMQYPEGDIPGTPGMNTVIKGFGRL